MKLHAMLLVMCLLGGIVAFGQTAAPKEGGFTCGLNAAYIFLNRSGRHVAYDELIREFQAQSPPDSLLAIKDVLAKHGCRTMGIKADANYFLGTNAPAIVYLHLDGTSLNGELHFSYLVQASKAGGVEFLDPVLGVDKATTVTWDTFTRVYKGMALVAHE
jgi:ABC-type bacteriocin/lantibiotic exporter with double-glycine peptidase domain